MEFKDYYATLRVAKNATSKDIKQAYRKLARTHHPDINPGDKTSEVRFKEVNEAYEVLGDSNKRKKYDELGANYKIYEKAQQTGRSSPETTSPFGSSNWTVNFRNDPGNARVYTKPIGENFDPGHTFSDFFKTFFGNITAEKKRQRQYIEQSIKLSLKEAFTGVDRRLSIKTGNRTRSVNIRIPAGVSDGARIRVVGKNKSRVTDIATEHLYLRVHLKPHSRFERKGKNLYVDISIPITTAVLGGQIELPSLNDQNLYLKIPETTQQGQVFRLKGKGMPILGKPNERGDLYATVNVQLPTQLTKKQYNYYKNLERIELEKKEESA